MVDVNQEKIEAHFGDTNLLEEEKVEVDKYIGRPVKIEKFEEFENPNGKFGASLYIIVSTEVLDKTSLGMEIRASKLFGLKKVLEGPNKGKIGWLKGSKLDGYLKKFGVSHYKELVGKEVKVQTEMRKNKAGEQQEYLTF